MDRGGGGINTRRSVINNPCLVTLNRACGAIYILQRPLPPLQLKGGGRLLKWLKRILFRQAWTFSREVRRLQPTAIIL